MDFPLLLFYVFLLQLLLVIHNHDDEKAKMKMRMREKFCANLILVRFWLNRITFFLWLTAFSITRSSFIITTWFIFNGWTFNSILYEFFALFSPTLSNRYNHIVRPRVKVKLRPRKLSSFLNYLLPKKKLYESRVELKSHRNIRKLWEWIKTIRNSIKSTFKSSKVDGSEWVYWEKTLSLWLL